MKNTKVKCENCGFVTEEYGGPLEAATQEDCCDNPEYTEA